MSELDEGIICFYNNRCKKRSISHTCEKNFEHDIEFPVLEEKQGETRKYPELNGLNANEVAAVFSVYLEEDAVNGYQEFLLKLRKEHRTLQQNFTRFAMRWLRDAGKKNPKLSWIREIKIWLPCI